MSLTLTGASKKKRMRAALAIAVGVSWLALDAYLGPVPAGNLVTVSNVTGLPFEVLPAGAPIYRGLLVGPSPGWDGTGGRGYGGANPAAPVDPARVTAKPVCRNVDVPGQWFDDDLVQGCYAAAEGGVRVYYWSEGTRTEVPLSTRLWADANGKRRKLIAYWVTHDHSAYIAQVPAGGEIQCYWEVVPNDPTMQSIVRPVDKFWAKPAGQLYENDIAFGTGLPTVAGASYPTLSAALQYVRSTSKNNVRLTCMTTGLYDMVTSSGTQGFNGGFVHIRSAPGVTCTIGKSVAPVTDGGVNMRPSLDSLHLIGSGVVFDFSWSGTLYADLTTRWHWLDGCRVTNSRGANSYWLKGGRPTLFRTVAPVAGEGGIAHYFTEVDCDNLAQPFVSQALARNCTLTNTRADIFTGIRCAIGNTITNYSNAFWTQDVVAFTVTYTGPAATATIEKIGINGSVGPIRITDALNGSRDVALGTSVASANYNVADVVAQINAYGGGWSATPGANADWDDRQACRLTKAGNASNSFGSFAPISVKDAVVTLVTAFDIHGDFYQQVSAQQNIVILGNRAIGFNNAQFALFDGSGSKDILFANNTVIGIDNVATTQVSGVQSNLRILHNTNPTSPFLMRSGFNPDAYCRMANNVFRSLSWEGAPDADIKIADNHLLFGTVPALATGTSMGGTVATLWLDAANDDFRPVGLLLSNQVAPVIGHDELGAYRPALCPKGAQGERFLGGPLPKDVAMSLLAISPTLPGGSAGTAGLQWKKAPLESGASATLLLSFAA